MQYSHHHYKEPTLVLCGLYTTHKQYVAIILTIICTQFILYSKLISDKQIFI